VPVTGCLHLKSACCHLGGGALLVNRRWFQSGAIEGFRLIDVAPSEPAAANALAIGGAVLFPSSFPATAEILERAGYRVRPLDISELQKAEAGITCSCLLFDHCGAGWP
jgi:dimethylargininase